MVGGEFEPSQTLGSELRADFTENWEVQGSPRGIWITERQEDCVV